MKRERLACGVLNMGFLVKRHRAKFGDVFALSTAKGFALLQYVNRRPKYAQLGRVLPGTYRSIPAELSNIVAQKELYFLFFPIVETARDGDLEFLGNYPIPPWAVEWPTMRHGPCRLPPHGKAAWWAIVGPEGRAGALDGHDQRRVQELSPEERKLSIIQRWSIPTLVDRIVEGWLPEHQD